MDIWSILVIAIDTLIIGALILGALISYSLDLQ